MSLEDLTLGLPPAYESQDDTDPGSFGSPSYTALPSESEFCLDQADVLDHQSIPNVYDLKWARLTLNSRKWGYDMPCYGLDDSIEGTATPLLDAELEEIQISLEGRLHLPKFHGNHKASMTIVSQTQTLHTPDEHSTFHLNFPSHVTLPGGVSPLPPSFSSTWSGYTCEVSYYLKLSAVSKASRFHARRVKTKCIEILYLPKTCPSVPPLVTIPRPPDLATDASLHLFDRVHTSHLQPTGISKIQNPDLSVNFSIPSPKIFPSGDNIPFTISLISRHDPVIPKLLIKHTRVTLYERVLLSSQLKGKQNDHHCPEIGTPKPIQFRQHLVATGKLEWRIEYKEGVLLLRGHLHAGEAGRYSSWKLPGLLEVEYFIRVSICPPVNMSERVPEFLHEEIIQLTTDQWGSIERELRAMGGIPTPALGLVSQAIYGSRSSPDLMPMRRLMKDSCTQMKTVISALSTYFELEPTESVW